MTASLRPPQETPTGPPTGPLPARSSVPTRHARRSSPARFWPVAALLALFAVSVVLRLPSFAIDPLEDQGWTQFQRFNNTEVWLHNEYVLSVYADEPAADHVFASYVGGGSDDFMASRHDPALTVYTSFPSTHFVVLYAALEAFGGSHTYQAAQVFGLALHLLSVALVAYLVHLLTRSGRLAVLGGAMYVFSTGTLWYHMNVYWAHQLFVPVFLAVLVLFVRRRGRLRWWHGLLVGLVLTLVTWTGAVAAVGFALYGGYRYLRTRDRAYLANGFAVVGMAVALGLVLLHLLVVTGAGPVEVLGRIVDRAGSRSAGATSIDLPVMAWHFVNDLLLDYGAFMVIAFALAVKRLITGFEAAVLFVAGFPLVESVAILEHDAVYGFGRLKWLLPVILLICLAGARLDPRRRAHLALAVAAACAFHAGLYFVVFDVPA